METKQKSFYLTLEIHKIRKWQSDLQNIILIGVCIPKYVFIFCILFHQDFSK